MSLKTALTYQYEKRRAVAGGILETAQTTFLLLVAVRWFEAGPNAKAFLAAANSIGLLLSPAVVMLAARWKLPPNVGASRLSVLGALSFFCASVLPGEFPFIIFSSLAITFVTAMPPLVTQIYFENYPERERGTLFSRTAVIRFLSAAIFGAAAGHLISGRIEMYGFLVAVFGIALLYSSYCFSKCESSPLSGTGGTRQILRGFRFIQTDSIFRNTLICWFLMGFGNLMMVPLRVEYLANERFGLQLSEVKVALLVSVLPNLVRLFMSPVWGHLFDRMNFFWLRVTINLGFMLGIVTFFTTGSMSALVIGALIFGVALAGGDVAWSLWVTKFAPPAHVADYMAVHTFFTGMRGIIAPVVAFHLLQIYSVHSLALFSAGLILCASFVLLPEIARERRKRAGAPVGL